MKLKFFAACILAMFAAAANAQAGYSLKGFVPGSKMSSCPANWGSERKGATLVCSSRSETLAGGPVALFELELFKGRLVSVSAFGVREIREVELALIAKFGMPVREANDDYPVWPMRGSTRMSLSKGKSQHVGVDDKVLFEEMKRAAQKDI